MTSINNPDLLQTLSNASQGAVQQRSGKTARENLPKAPPIRDTSLSSEQEIQDAAKRITGGEFRREAPLAINHSPGAGVKRDEPLGQIVDIKV